MHFEHCTITTHCQLATLCSANSVPHALCTAYTTHFAHCVLHVLHTIHCLFGTLHTVQSAFCALCTLYIALCTFVLLSKWVFSKVFWDFLRVFFKLFCEFLHTKTGYDRPKIVYNHLTEHPKKSRITFRRMCFRPFFEPPFGTKMTPFQGLLEFGSVKCGQKQLKIA